MCVGIPMQVTALQGPLTALCRDRDGSVCVVNTALVGAVQADDWLLVFLGSAREVISANRAHEVLSMLSLLELALQGGEGVNDASLELPFLLPSQMPLSELMGQNPSSHTSLNPTNAGNQPSFDPPTI